MKAKVTMPVALLTQQALIRAREAVRLFEIAAERSVNGEDEDFAYILCLGSGEAQNAQESAAEALKKYQGETE